jgi:uncharacterized repeat protein (TIGR03943 family)
MREENLSDVLKARIVLTQRSLRLALLAAWTCCLLLLWLGGQVDRYLGPRTAWVVPFGGITLALATLAYAAVTTDGPATRRGVTRRETLTVVALIAPVLVLFTFADATLGSLAASRKLSSRGIDAASLVRKMAAGKAQTSLLAINVAEDHPNLAAESGVRPGAVVRLRGFVMTPPGASGGSFTIARLFITCCVADAVALRAHVLGAPAYAANLHRDAWVEVDGTVLRRDGHIYVRAAKVQPIAQPSDPYATFTS